MSKTVDFSTSHPKRYFPSLPWCHPPDDTHPSQRFTTIHLECQFRDVTLTSDIEVCVYHLRQLRRARLLRTFTDIGQQHYSSDFNISTDTLSTSIDLKIASVFSTCHNEVEPLPHVCLRDILPFFRLEYKPYPYSEKLQIRRCQIQNRTLNCRDYTTEKPTSYLENSRYMRPAVLHVSLSNGKVPSHPSVSHGELHTTLDILLLPSPCSAGPTMIRPTDLSLLHTTKVENSRPLEITNIGDLQASGSTDCHTPSSNPPGSTRHVMYLNEPLGSDDSDSDSIAEELDYVTDSDDLAHYQKQRSYLRQFCYENKRLLPRPPTPPQLSSSSYDGLTADSFELKIGTLQIDSPELLHEYQSSTSRTDSDADSFESATLSDTEGTPSYQNTAITTPNTTVTSIFEHG